MKRHMLGASSLRLALGICFALSSLLGSVSCAEGTPQPAAPMQPPNEAVTSLTYYLVPARTQNPMVSSASDSIRSALVTAGFKVVTDESEPHDVTLTMRADGQEQHSMFNVVVNGKQTHKYTVTLALSAMFGTQVADDVQTQFTAEDTITAEQVQPLINKLASSAKIAKLAKARAAQGETDAWLAADVMACKVPAKLDACQGVQRYLAQHKDGPHAAEASDVLKAAEPQLEKLQKDHAAWAKAGAKACQARAGKDACDGVRIYIEKYPTGLHADDAKILLAGDQQ